MYSAYFFACALNILFGYLLFTKQDEGQKDSTQEQARLFETAIFNNQWKLIIAAAVIALTAIAKILAPTSNNVPVIGDIVPAASLGIISIVLILRIGVLSNSSNAVQKQHQLLSYSRYIGIIAMIVGGVHVFLHGALFL